MRNRSQDHREEAPLPATPVSRGGPEADEAARRARRLLDIGDDAIRRALSGDSERFLEQNRQQGGE